ncbi:hypothetical protein [Jiangella alba]|uniref:Uncharacterized protein n=1 Tax=Jiangella alba TaxID=561176 RepID=A0A1H5PKM7_9ACTN|nr:hypothetical protein [Jiangella alba]SEF13778.1 hypothetical protein SAMN04488561_4471 [Jiangella alba]
MRPIRVEFEADPTELIGKPTMHPDSEARLKAGIQLGKRMVEVAQESDADTVVYWSSHGPVKDGVREDVWVIRRRRRVED